ncbi:protein TolQ [Sinisalibacter aestuarii]|uniref:Tol-Pal system protein TolQ n=1 Tax=Sinisalibacter aestuarii TaxID=2949426 RepID=A0ABQ5LVP2_9RHOB|nr:protein TolQ [Sinisalibacter aestuarii]GKY88668.1 Tol-Pal system subunit TolQ [Sinisalibacter aestuarii]
METEILASAQEIDFSFFALFLRATLIVKLVMLLLLAASFYSWAIIVTKFIQYRKARAEAAVFDQSFWSGNPLDELFDDVGPSPDSPSEKVFAAGMLEWRRSHKADGGLIGGAQSRIDRSMDVAIAKEAEGLNKGLSFLATVASSAPFIGLFGTVWGIMHSFIEIAQQQNTNLAVVAPGIAEALFATGLGLLAAIPALIFYNKLTADSDGIVAGWEAFADEFATILSRQLDS